MKKGFSQQSGAADLIWKGPRFFQAVVPVAFVGQRLTEAQAAAERGLVVHRLRVLHPRPGLLGCAGRGAGGGGEQGGLGRFDQGFPEDTAHVHQSLQERRGRETSLDWAWGSVWLYLQQVQQRHGLQHGPVMFQQRPQGDSRLGHDAAEDALQHALAHRPVQAAVHHPPRTADEAQGVAADGGNRGVRR